MLRYSVKPRTRKYVKAYGFLSFARNRSDKCGEKVIGYCYKNRIRCCKSCFQKKVHKTAEATRQLIVNKYWKKVGNQNLYLMRIQKMLKKQLFCQRKDRKILNELREVL